MLSRTARVVLGCFAVSMAAGTARSQESSVVAPVEDGNVSGIAAAGFAITSPPMGGFTYITPKVTWSAYPGAANYRIQISPDPTFAAAVIDVAIQSAYLKFDSPYHVVRPGETYYCRVSALTASYAIIASAPVSTFTVIDEMSDCDTFDRSVSTYASLGWDDVVFNGIDTPVIGSRAGHASNFRYDLHEWYGGDIHAFHRGPTVWSAEMMGSLDHLEFSYEVGAFDNPIGVGMCVSQNGYFWFASSYKVHFYGWSTASGTLGPSDWFRIDGGPGPALPDFSVTGAPLHFGYVTANGAAPGDVIHHQNEHGVDNWCVHLYGASEPACPADYNGSGGTPDANDIMDFIVDWLAGGPGADVDGSGGTPDANDINFFILHWLAGC